MNKLFLIIIIALFLSSCESREERIQKAVSQELKGVLYDFESYEPIKTQIDSAFSSPYIDLEVKYLMFEYAKCAEELEQTLDDLSSIEYSDELELYSSDYSSILEKGTDLKRKGAKNRIENAQKKLKSAIRDLYAQIQKVKDEKKEFVGWFVTQRYKCKTGGGYPAFGDDIFVFNKDMTECICHMSAEEYEGFCNFINKLVSLPEDEFIEKINGINLLE